MMKYMLSMVIVMILAMALMFVWNPMEGTVWDMPLFMLVLMVPMFFIVLFTFPKQKILFRYKANQKREKILKERENKQ